MQRDAGLSGDMKKSWLVAGLLALAYAGLAHYLSIVTDLGAWFSFLQNVGINTVLAVFFGRTLRAGRRPLVTTLAAAVHEEMSPQLLRYTRQVTVAWTLFFVACVVLSVLLFFAAPIEVWSWFANILALPLIGLMFLVEYEVRKRVLPKRDLLGLLATVRAVRANFRS